MDADRGVDPVMLLGERNGRVEAVRAGAAADGENAFYACGPRAIEHGGAIVVKLRKLQMRVRIDDFQGNDFLSIH